MLRSGSNAQFHVNGRHRLMFPALNPLSLHWRRWTPVWRITATPKSMGTTRL
ncbi:hypothetical protein BKA82DRAFT_1004978 [Pisolithus tinctorius]|uniref:Uncharacterized protein n=1 Tax=Pisolithus tinctorius Marx 270 TaxID=870435 RepID=A0A0C3NUM2_PISTI|nr:hypothetical protein BKA82DRAFT_1004978 [Pisolithus tinctorius]KIN99135.1 hypothetical protein M404DRAFT_1004978 [Pisolithus tinctorius Marx 270]KIO11012.1 hypothetical protein M404DRAFT_994676 [Pisolithus tinctorius Marx 270]